MAAFQDFVSMLQAEVDGGLNTVVQPLHQEPVSTPSVVPTPVSVTEPSPVPVPSPVPAPVYSPPSVSNSETGSKLRILLVGTHIQQTTGYAKVMHGMIRTLATIPWIDLTHYAIQYIGSDPLVRKYPTNVRVINVAQIEAPGQGSARRIPPGFGFAELPAHIRETKPHIVLIYNDLMIIHEYLESIRKANLPRTFKLWTYLDVVYPYPNPIFIDMLNREVDRIFCFTKEWRDILRQQSITRPIDVLPHAFEEGMFYPISKVEARKAANIPEDAFVILNINRNQPRKRHDILIMAFTELMLKHPTRPIYLMCVCDRGDGGGYPLFEIFARELALRNASVDEFGGRLLVATDKTYYTDDQINIFYNLADCGASCAEGEGFGLCAFEQMGVGVPQVLSDVVGHREYCEHGKSGILVPTRIRSYLSSGNYPIGGETNNVDYREFARGIEQYLLDDMLRKVHGKSAKEKVMSYTWDRSLKTFLRRARATFDEMCEDSD